MNNGAVWLGGGVESVLLSKGWGRVIGDEQWWQVQVGWVVVVLKLET